MPTTIADNRRFIAMTPTEADALMREIADAEIELARNAAQAEREIADIKRIAEGNAAPHRAILEQARAALDRYIAAHPERFVKPRARKTDWGDYGLRSVAGLEIADETPVLAFCLERRMGDCVETKLRLKRDGIAKAIAEGVDFPGVSIVSGERSFYKVRKSLLDSAKREEA